jgi:hypothetical protein
VIGARRAHLRPHCLHRLQRMGAGIRLLTLALHWVSNAVGRALRAQ